MIKALFFDFDGVLTSDKTGSLTTTRYISVATVIDHARVTAAFATYNDDLTRGCASVSFRNVWRVNEHDESTEAEAGPKGVVDVAYLAPELKLSVDSGLVITLR